MIEGSMGGGYHVAIGALCVIIKSANDYWPGCLDPEKLTVTVQASGCGSRCGGFLVCAERAGPQQEYGSRIKVPRDSAPFASSEGCMPTLPATSS